MSEKEEKNCGRKADIGKWKRDRELSRGWRKRDKKEGKKTGRQEREKDGEILEGRISLVGGGRIDEINMQ